MTEAISDAPAQLTRLIRLAEREVRLRDALLDEAAHETSRLREIEAAARVQHETYGAWAGLVEALNR